MECDVPAFSHILPSRNGHACVPCGFSGFPGLPVFQSKNLLEQEEDAVEEAVVLRTIQPTVDVTISRYDFSMVSSQAIPMLWMLDGKYGSSV